VCEEGLFHYFNAIGVGFLIALDMYTRASVMVVLPEKTIELFEKNKAFAAVATRR